MFNLKSRANSSATVAKDLESLLSTVPARNSGYLLWQTTLGWQRLIRLALEPYGITQVQFVLITCTWRLEESGEDVTQRRVAAKAGIDEMMTSQVLRRLESAGLVVRKKSPRDARARIIELTDKGRETLAGALVDVRALNAEFFGHLGGGEESFHDALGTLADATEHMRRSGD